MKATGNIEEKIKKLLALSQSSNPNEAKAALLKAQDLQKESKFWTKEVLKVMLEVTRRVYLWIYM